MLVFSASESRSKIVGLAGVSGERGAHAYVTVCLPVCETNHGDILYLTTMKQLYVVHLTGYSFIHELYLSHTGFLDDIQAVRNLNVLFVAGS